MPTDGNAKVQRKLAAILAADIAGYSTLMGADESRTVRDLKGHQAVVLPMIANHGGRIIDTAGDGILAEFGSVVNAAECAVALQKTMAARNVTVEPERQMRFRIGINLGDVIHDEDRLYGDGMNIAARLEGIADPGGICVSGAAYDQVHKKLPLTFTDLGAQQLKNIAAPVRVYRIDPKGSGRTSPAAEQAPLALADKPSIAVLPFTNMSGDASQEYFSDGITEDIITELSRFSELAVIARNSSFQYKGKSPDIRQVGLELNVRYVLEGSVRSTADRVRVTAQLIDTSNGAPRWAERYDRMLTDVFAIQDDVARTIAGILAAHVNKAEAERSLLKSPSAWQAYDYYLRASETLHSFFSSYLAQDLYKCREFLNLALSLDPRYGRAYVLLAHTYTTAYVNAVDQDYLQPATLDRAEDLLRKAIALNANSAQAHTFLGQVLVFKRMHIDALAQIERAIALNTNYTDWRHSQVYVLSGHFTRAVETAREHIRLDPFHTNMAYCNWGMALYMLKRHEEALWPLRESVIRAPKQRTPHVWLAINYAQLGMMDDAKQELAILSSIQPGYTVETAKRHLVFPNPVDTEYWLAGLRSAGLRER